MLAAYRRVLRQRVLVRRAQQVEPMIHTVTSATARPRTMAQALMEWDPLVWLYESRLWRRSVVWQALFGISFDREYSLIRSALDLSRAHRILDLACGPGIYARLFAAEVPLGTVTGMDLSKPMLRYAVTKSRKARLERLSFVRGDATELPFPRNTFDAVNCCGALHLFPDVDRTLAEMRRVLKDDGTVTMAVFRRGDGPIAELRTAIRRKLYGIGAFSERDLASRLDAAGFAGRRCLHAVGLWLIMSAQKAAA
jgi:SAM-dependent methyltransferase